MAYVEQIWKDRQVQYPNRYVDQNGNILYLTRSPGTITENGSLFNAEKMNHIEEGIKEIDNNMIYFTESTTLNDLVIKSNLLGNNSKIDASEIAIIDSNNSVKNLDDYLEETSKFSTTEEIFSGKYWIDGKPIYRKVWTIGASSTLNTDISISAPITNLDKIVDFRGMVYFDNYNVPWNFYNWANTSYSYIAFYRNGNINYRIARAISSANFIIEYTKNSS